MAYTTTNYKSKAALKRALAAGETVTAFQPGGLFHQDGLPDGNVALEGTPARRSRVGSSFPGR